MKFFTGMHIPSLAHHLPAACISIRVIRDRTKGFRPPAEWIMDSGAFSELTLHGRYQHSAHTYAAFAYCQAELTPNLLAIVAQDYMCEARVLRKTGLTIADHQRLTISRYDELLDRWLLLRPDIPIIPVLQGWTTTDYLTHLNAYGERLTPNMWVGVGSVCKRQGNPSVIREILLAIKGVRPDLRLHGFGVKVTALRHSDIHAALHSADSMAWSFAARAEGRGPDANKWEEALKFHNRILELEPR